MSKQLTTRVPTRVSAHCNLAERRVTRLIVRGWPGAFEVRQTRGELVHIESWSRRSNETFKFDDETTSEGEITCTSSLLGLPEASIEPRNRGDKNGTPLLMTVYVPQSMQLKVDVRAS